MGPLWSPSGNIFPHILQVLSHDIDEQNCSYLVYIVPNIKLCQVILNDTKYNKFIYGY